MVPVLGVRQAWVGKVGAVDRMPLDVHVSGYRVTLASADGTVAAIDARTGSDLWRVNVGEPLAAGVGSDGKHVAVVSRGNQLIVVADGREAWRQSLPAQVYTAPLVAGERVFVLAADRSLSAYDAATGKRLWSQQRPGEPLVLRQSGVLMAVGDTLVAGMSGRMVGFNPNNGTVRWEAPIATPRGTNDVERLVELVGHTSRVGDSVCARAFQSAVGCVNTSRGSVAWSQTANGATGIHGDEKLLFGTESNGSIVAWRRADGSRAWVSDRLQYRKLTAPLLLGRSVVVGDDAGWVHLLSKDDGTPLNRIATDGSAIAAAPVVAADTLVVVTRNGNVYGFRPE
jgi:outer membrane assembly lipoprotein YfgL